MYNISTSSDLNMSCDTHITMLFCCQIFLQLALQFYWQFWLIYITHLLFVRMNEKYHHYQLTKTCSKLAAKILENSAENLAIQPGNVGSWRLYKHSLIFICSVEQELLSTDYVYLTWKGCNAIVLHCNLTRESFMGVFCTLKVKLFPELY